VWYRSPGDLPRVVSRGDRVLRADLAVAPADRDLTPALVSNDRLCASDGLGLGVGVCRRPLASTGHIPSAIWVRDYVPVGSHVRVLRHDHGNRLLADPNATIARTTDTLTPSSTTRLLISHREYPRAQDASCHGGQAHCRRGTSWSSMHQTRSAPMSLSAGRRRDQRNLGRGLLGRRQGVVTSAGYRRL